MSSTLDALRRIESMRIESKPTAAQLENADSMAEVQRLVQFAVDSDLEDLEDLEHLEADNEDVNCRADAPIVQTLSFEPPSEVIQPEPQPRLGRPWAKPAEGAYVDLAKTVTGRLGNDRHGAILVTSPGDGEGKTRTVMGLAEVLARQDSGKVLVVDGNSRRPGLGLRPR